MNKYHFGVQEVDFFRRTITTKKIDPNDKTFLKIREYIPTKSIEVNIESTGTAQEEPVSLDTTDQQATTEKKHWKRKERARLSTSHHSVVLLCK